MTSIVLVNTTQAQTHLTQSSGKCKSLNEVKSQTVKRKSSSPPPSSDGYIKYFKVGKVESPSHSPRRLTVDNVSEGLLKREVISPIPSKKVTPAVSLLAGKYLMLPISNAPSSFSQGASVKSESICVDVNTKEQYLCKIIPRNPKGLAMLAAYHRLDDCSEFVNQVVEAILTPQLIYFIMPKNYGSVHSYLLAKKNLLEPEAANIFMQIVQTVELCHSKGVILRDIKMGRFVFVDKAKSKVKLESLEDAVLLVDPDMDALEDKHGCPNYVSPEKAEILKSGLKYPGKATDVWALGIILFTLVVGRYPFNDLNCSRLLQKIRLGEFAIPEGLSDEITQLIKSLLQKSPSRRPSCKNILNSSWIKMHSTSETGSPQIFSPAVRRSEVNRLAISRDLRTSFHDQLVPNL